VRRRTTDLSPEDRTAFTREANASGVAQMGTGERARADAAALSPGALELLQSGDVHAAGNRAFVRAFVDTLPESERGGMMTASGELSKAGAERVRNALLARAYGDPDLIARLAEEPESGLGGLGRALIEAAPTWAKLRDEVPPRPSPRTRRWPRRRVGSAKTLQNWRPSPRTRSSRATTSRCRATSRSPSRGRASPRSRQTEGAHARREGRRDRRPAARAGRGGGHAPRGHPHPGRRGDPGRGRGRGAAAEGYATPTRRSWRAC
jgi:hypothetical protein